MDPLTLATTFATVLSLIGQFRSEQGTETQADFNEFVVWLSETQHDEIKELLESNARTVIGIKALLKEDREILAGQLEKLDMALTSFASGFVGFSGIAEGLRPNSVLSEQALDLLKQFEASGASKMMAHHSFDGLGYLFVDHQSGSHEVNITDARFLEDDLNVLTNLNLLIYDCNSQGNDMYIFTRAASALVKS